MFDNSSGHVIFQRSAVGSLDRTDLCSVGLLPLLSHTDFAVIPLSPVLNAGSPSG